MVNNSLILLGGGGHCKACIDVIELENKFTIAGIIDIPEKVGDTIFGYPIIGSDNDIQNFALKYRNFIVTLGQIKSPENRIRLFSILKSLNLNIPSIISPLAYVSKHSFVGAGTIVFHQAVVNAGASIGENCIINTKSLIEHDAIIENHCHISTAAVINGGVKIGSGTFFGSSAVTKEGIIIPENSFIKANSIVK